MDDSHLRDCALSSCVYYAAIPWRNLHYQAQRLPNEAEETSMDLATVDKLLTTTRTVRKRLDFTRPIDLRSSKRVSKLLFRHHRGEHPTLSLRRGDRCRQTYCSCCFLQTGILGGVFPQRQAEVRQSDPRLIDSATYLAEHMHEVPVLIIPCVEASVVQGTGPGAYASILPATWSLMALRARGVGSAWTTPASALRAGSGSVLGIPDGIRQAALLPVAYYTGYDFKPAKRVPARERTYWNGWGQKRRGVLWRGIMIDQHSALRCMRSLSPYVRKSIATSECFPVIFPGLVSLYPSCELATEQWRQQRGEPYHDEQSSSEDVVVCQ